MSIIKVPEMPKKSEISSYKNNEKISKKNIKNSLKKITRKDMKLFPTLKLKTEREIAEDFTEKIYRRFDKLIKSVVLFGSTIKKTRIVGSDIDIIIIVDDATVKFDEELIFWYRTELGKIIEKNPYKHDLHINTIKLTTWWNDLFKGDPVAINILRYGEAIADVGGFFNPLKILLQDGKIKPTPESMYVILNRIPGHIIRSKQAEMSAIEGCYWAMVESAQALLMAVKVLPPSPEHIPALLKKYFVEKKLLKQKYVKDIEELYELHRKIIHGNIRDLQGKIIDGYQDIAEDFFRVTMKLIEEII